MIGAPLRQWWHGLDRRERSLVAGAAALALVALLYVLAIEPAWKARDRLGAELPRLRAQAVEMQSLAREAAQLRGRGVAAESASAAKEAMEKTLAAAGLGTVRVSALDERRLALSVKGARVAPWLAWLEQTARESRLRIAVAQISRTPARGVVDAEVTLEIARP